jgi:general secretion pathway protein F
VPVYEYKALNRKGRRVSGIVTAEAASAARQKLTLEGVFPERVQEVRSGRKLKKGEARGRSSRFRLQGRVNPDEVSASLRQLATLISSGLPLMDCLQTLVEQTDQRRLKRVFTEVREEVAEGKSLSQALADHRGVFGDITVHMTGAGEEGGALDVILLRLADFSERRIKLRKKVETALTYPLFLVLISGVIVVFLMAFVMPKVVGIFEGMDMVLPWSTRTLIWVTDALRQWWWALLAGAVVLAAAGAAWVRTAVGRRIWDGTRLRAPVMGKVHKKAVIARFTQTLAILLQSGIPLVKALEIARHSAGNRVVERALAETAKRVGEGQDFATPLRDTGLFPPLVVQLVRAGERSGDLEGMLGKAAERYEEDVEASLGSLSSLLEPAIILAMGLVVAFMVMAVLLPIFDMTQGIG